MDQNNSAPSSTTPLLLSPPSPPLPKAKFFIKPIFLLIGFLLVVTASVLAAMMLKQRSGQFNVQEKAEGCSMKAGDSCSGNSFLCKLRCECNVTSCQTNSINLKCDNGKVVEYPDSTGCDGENKCAGDSHCSGSSGGGSSGTCDKPCPGGSEDCNKDKGEQCTQNPGNTACPNSCKVISNDVGLQGCCNSDSDCASWEKCETGNSACNLTGGKSCRSRTGCTSDSDCTSGAKCVSGVCSGGTGGTGGTLECRATSDGVSITNNTNSDLTNLQVEWFARWCNDNGGATCSCGGGPTTVTVNIGKGKTWHQGMSNSGPPNLCAWQSDVKVLNGSGVAVGCNNANAGCTSGCQNPPTVTPIPPTATPILPTATPTQVIPTATPTPRISLTPTLTPTQGPNPACVKLDAFKVTSGGTKIALDQTGLNNLQIGERVLIEMAFNGTVEDSVIVVKKDGNLLRSSNTRDINGKVIDSFTVESGSYQFLGFVKYGGVWH